MTTASNDRRKFLRATGVALTTSIFTGKVKGANDRIRLAFIGTGIMGRYNLKFAMMQPGVEVATVCDVYQPNLEGAVADTQNKARGCKDFREIIADQSIDAVCISTPDHWHAYMTVEACKAGKDVYVEKPICVAVEEGRKMVHAARKYNRVVQVGTWQRSGVHFQQAAEIVRSGQLGKVTFVRCINYGLASPEGIGNPPDSEPPPGLDWDLWLGPAPRRPFNPNRFGVGPGHYSYFRWFWDYAGGMMTDWGIHWLDIVQMAFDEAVPLNVTAMGGKFWLKDDRETPDTLQVTFEYPGFVATYENRSANGQSLFDKGAGILFHGTKGTLFVDRSLYRLIPEPNSDLKPAEQRSSNKANVDHWANFLDCVRARRNPVSDIEIGHRSTTTCLLGNVAFRSKQCVDWDGKNEVTTQQAARKYLDREYRMPWKLAV